MTVITISRHPGSLGDTIARVLAARLHYRLVERAELVEISERIGGRDVAWERTQELLERSPTFWERLTEEQPRYISVLRRAMADLAEQGDVVIVGLGGGQVLRGLRGILRLQVIAPPEIRLERVMARGFDQVKGPLSHDRARDLIRTTDRNSSGYMHYLFNIDWSEPQHWDLVINTGVFTVEETVTMVTVMVHSGALEPSALDRQRLANLALASRVEATLLCDPSVWISHLWVVAQQGRIQIQGEVIAEQDRDVAERVVQSIDGVQSIENNLLLQPPPVMGM